MEILIKENRLLKDSELFFFEQGIPINNDVQLVQAKALVVSLSEESFCKIFNGTSDEYAYTCRSTVELVELEKKRIAKRILYFIRCRDQGSREFVLCTNLITKKEIFVEYINGNFQQKLTSPYIQVIIERKPTHLFRLEVDKYQIIGYTLNVGLDNEILTKSIFTQLIQDDIKGRVVKLFNSTKGNNLKLLPLRELHYDAPIVKRYNDVVALSDFLVMTLEIKKDSYVLLREIKNDIFVSFLNLDDEEQDIHLKVNSTRYARRSFIDSTKFPLVIYLKYASRIDLFSFLEDETEYEVDLEPKSFEGNVWYRIK